MSNNTNKLFIYRTENSSANKTEELQDEWLSANHPDKTLIGGEDNTSIILNEESNTLICMEYTELV